MLAVSERGHFIIRIGCGRTSPCQVVAAECRHRLDSGGLVALRARPDRRRDFPAGGVGDAFDSGIADARRLGLRNLSDALHQVRAGVGRHAARRAKRRCGRGQQAGAGAAWRGLLAALLGFLAAGFVATLRAGTATRFTGLLSIAATRSAGTAARAAAETGGLCKWCSGTCT